METAETRRPSRHHPRADPQRVDRAVTADPRYLLPPWWAGALRAARRSPNRLVVPTRVHLAHLRHRKPLAAPTQAFSCSCSQQHSSMLRLRGILRARSNSMQHSHPLPMWVHQTLLQSLRRRRWHCNQGARGGGDSGGGVSAITHDAVPVGPRCMRSRPDAVLSPSTKAARERQNCPPSPQVRATALPTRWPDANFDFTAFDTVRVRDGALAYCPTYRGIPSDGSSASVCQAERRYLLSALGPPLQRIRKCFEEGGADYDCEADVELERALKAKMISTEVLLRKASRGGKRGRMAVSARLRRWNAGDQAFACS